MTAVTSACDAVMNTSLKEVAHHGIQFSAHAEVHRRRPIRNGPRTGTNGPVQYDDGMDECVPGKSNGRAGRRERCVHGRDVRRDKIPRNRKANRWNESI